MQKRRFSKEFKLSVLRELDSGKPMAVVCRENEINQNVAGRWKREYRQDPQKAFAGRGNIWKQDARDADLERKIGQQTMEIDFLKRVNANLQAHLSEIKKTR